MGAYKQNKTNVCITSPEPIIQVSLEILIDCFRSQTSISIYIKNKSSMLAF